VGKCIIFVFDTHFKGINPESRIDDYPSSILDKIAEVVEVANNEDASCIVIGGDLNDIPRMADQQAGRLAQVLNQARCSKYVVPGSHDLYGYSMDSLYQTKLGLLIKSGVLNLLSRETGVEYVDIDGHKVALEGQEFTNEIDTRDPALDYWVKGNGEVNILVTHSMLLDKPFLPGIIPQTLIADFPNTEAIQKAHDGDTNYKMPDVVLAGHYHPGWPIQEKDGIIFGNSGSLARNSASPDSFTRTPSYAKGWFENGKFKVEYFPLKSVKPADEVLDRTHLDDAKIRKDSIEEFKSIVGDNFNKTDVIGIISDIVLKDGLPIEMKERLFKRVREAQALVDDRDESLKDFMLWPSNIWIKNAHIRNFQSHEDTYVEFTPGLNVITGRNDQGKSAIGRALRWLFFDEPKHHTRFISSFAGKEPTSVSTELSNGVKVSRWRTKTNTGEYILEMPGESVETFRSTDGMPPKVRSAIGMIPISLTKGEKTILNVANQHDPPFLVGLSGPASAEMIGQLTHVESVDKAISDINSEIQATDKIVRAKQQDVEREITLLEDASQDLDKLERKVELVSSALKGLDKLEKELKMLEEINAELQALNSQDLQLASAIKECGNPNKAKEEILQAELAYRSFDSLRRISNSLDELRAQEKSIQDTLRTIPDVNKAVEEANRATEVASFLREIVQLEETYSRLRGEKSTVEAALSKIGDIVQAHKSMTQAQENIVHLAVLRDISERYESLQMERTELSSRIPFLTSEIKSIQERYATIFEELGVCPFCMSALSEEQITKLGGGVNVAS
jgi:predicted MPP superfamily phosphohydrolase